MEHNDKILVPIEPPDYIPEDFDLILFEMCRNDDYRGLYREFIKRIMMETEIKFFYDNLSTLNKIAVGGSVSRNGKTYRSVIAVEKKDVDSAKTAIARKLIEEAYGA